MRRDGLLACEKSDGKTPLVTPGDGVAWLNLGRTADDDDGIDLHATLVTELELNDGTWRVRLLVFKKND